MARVLILGLGLGLSCFAQQWELGGSAGAGFRSGVSVTSPKGNATTGFKPGVAFGVFLSQKLNPRFSGEVRYGFLQNNLRLSSGGDEATFSGLAHVLHYDVLIHSNRAESSMQPFAIVGGGMKVFRGTGKEAAYQPLSQFGYFTKTQEVKPMASVGGGLRFMLSPRVYLRVEVRDFITTFPEEIIAPAPGAKFGSVLHQIVPMVGISYQY
jgi:hypothetical protein